MERILAYFPDLSPTQQDLLTRLKPLYQEWNSKINLISRQDMENFYIRHVLFSMSVSRLLNFAPGTTVIDIGTGGGFPGIPLAILYPEVSFSLLDSITKKIKVVAAVKEELNLQNVTPINSRSENYKGSFDFVIGRAVTALPDFYNQTKHLMKKAYLNKLPNGILYFSGGETLTEGLPRQSIVNEWPLSKWFTEEFFNTKKIIHLSLA